MKEDSSPTKALNKNRAESENSQVFEDLETNNTTITKFEIEKKGEMSFLSQRNFGTTIALLLVNDEPLITIGPHWPYFMCMWTVLLIIGALVGNFVSAKYGFLVKAITYFLVFWEAFIYLLTALKNPGIVSKKFDFSPDAIEDSKDAAYCKICHVVRGNEIRHCDDCDVCVGGYDHHCPWTGKCIGKGNIYPFYAFIVSTMIYLVYCIVICAFTVD